MSDHPTGLSAPGHTSEWSYTATVTAKNAPGPQWKLQRPDSTHDNRQSVTRRPSSQRKRKQQNNRTNTTATRQSVIRPCSCSCCCKEQELLRFPFRQPLHVQERANAKVGEPRKHRQNQNFKERKTAGERFGREPRFLVRRVLYNLFPLRLRMRP